MTKSLKRLFYIGLSLVVLVGCGTDDSGSSGQDGPSGDNSDWLNNGGDSQGGDCVNFGDTSREIGALSGAERDLMCENVNTCFYGNEAFLFFTESLCIMTSLQISTDVASCEENVAACVNSMLENSSPECDGSSFTDCNQTVGDLEACYLESMAKYQSHSDSIAQLELDCDLVEDQEALTAVMLQAGDLVWDESEPIACQVLDQSCP